jgi:hypothetical protein
MACTMAGRVICPNSARPVRWRGLFFARDQLHRLDGANPQGTRMMFRLIAKALLGDGFLMNVGAAAARDCKVFTPDELKDCTYRNVDGCEVPCPKLLRGSVCPPPRDAVYRCADGDWSFSQHSRGACSHHGGVRCAIEAGQDCCP